MYGTETTVQQRGRYAVKQKVKVWPFKTSLVYEVEQDSDFIQKTPAVQNRTLYEYVSTVGEAEY